MLHDMTSQTILWVIRNERTFEEHIAFGG